MVWIPIEYFETYHINEEGEILSYRSGRPKLLKPRVNKYGYARINLVNNEGKQYTKEIHRLVAETFIPNPENKPTVDHVDRNRLNNHVSNLRWADYHDQQANTKGQPHSKGITLRNIKTGEVRSWDTLKGCARDIGSHPKSLRNLRQGKAKTTKGWELVQD